MDIDSTKPYKVGIRGPRGSILLVNVLAKNPKKIKNDIAFNIKKIGGTLSNEPLEGYFNRKGVIIAQPPTELKNVDEVSIEHAIEVGAEEVSPLDESNSLTFYCDVPQLHQVKNNLRELKYHIEDAKLTYIPRLKVSLGEDEMDVVSRVIDKLETLPEVIEIYDNLE